MCTLGLDWCGCPPTSEAVRRRKQNQKWSQRGEGSAILSPHLPPPPPFTLQSFFQLCEKQLKTVCERAKPFHAIVWLFKSKDWRNTAHRPLPPRSKRLGFSLSVLLEQTRMDPLRLFTSFLFFFFAFTSHSLCSRAVSPVLAAFYCPHFTQTTQRNRVIAGRPVLAHGRYQKKKERRVKGRDRGRYPDSPAHQWVQEVTSRLARAHRRWSLLPHQHSLPLPQQIPAGRWPCQQRCIDLYR